MQEIVIYPRQDGCCPERLKNIQVSVHTNNNDQIGGAVWTTALFTDGSNAGSGPGVKVSITAALDAAGKFEGQWIQILWNPLTRFSALRGMRLAASSITR